MKSPSKSRKEPSTAAALLAVQKELASMRRRLDRADDRIKSLESKVIQLEKERDHFKDLYYKALADIRVKDKRIAVLERKLEQAEKQLAWFRKQHFGQKTEAGAGSGPSPKPADDDEEQEPLVPKSTRKRGQQPGSKGHGRTNRSSISEADPEISSIADPVCNACHKPFAEFGTTEDSHIVEIETLIYKRVIKRKRYAKRCNCSGLKGILTAPAPPKLYPKTSLGNSIWVHLCAQKFLHGTPTNRILKDLALKGLGLSAGTVTGGLKVINDLINPLYEALKTHCQSDNLWNADETSWRVFEDGSGNRNKKKWWLWVIAGQKSVVYILDQSRSAEVPEQFFGGSTGALLTDRFGSYKGLHGGILKAWCWVHVRRDFIKLFDGVPNLRAWARKWLLDIGQLFVLNHRRFALWSAKKTFGSSYQAADSDLQTHVEYLEKNWKLQLQNHSHPEQRTVLNSLKRHWAGLTRFLQDPRIPLDNNRAERLLRTCVIQRKNSYGSGSEWSGEFSAKLFSLFQTWLLNGLDPESMLLDYFNACSISPGHPPPNIDKFLPWKMSADSLVDFALPQSYSRPA